MRTDYPKTKLNYKPEGKRNIGSTQMGWGGLLLLICNINLILLILTRVKMDTIRTKD